MHEIAVSATIAGVLFILPTRCLPEICDWGELCNDGPSIVVTVLEPCHGVQRSLFLCKLNIHVADQMIGVVVANVQALNLAMPCQLFKDVLVESLHKTKFTNLFKHAHFLMYSYLFQWKYRIAAVDWTIKTEKMAR